MPIKPEFLQDGNKQTVGLSSFVRTELKSGDIFCHKCGERIPDKELFCIPCFGEALQRPARAPRPKPDEGGLFESVPAIELGHVVGGLK